MPADPDAVLATALAVLGLHLLLAAAALTGGRSWRSLARAWGGR